MCRVMACCSEDSHSQLRADEHGCKHTEYGYWANYTTRSAAVRLVTIFQLFENQNQIFSVVSLLSDFGH